MYKTVIINGREYPISFGTAALVAFEQETGISISTIGETTPYSNSIRLIYFGLRDGARKAGQSFALDFQGVCDVIDEDAQALTRLMEVFEQSMPDTDGEKKTKEKAA